MTHQVDIMIDLETLDTKSTSAILTLAAVPFNSPALTENNSNYFYERVDPNYYTERPEFTQSVDTVKFHTSLPQDVFDENTGGTESLYTVLHLFSAYCKSLGTVRVWGNAAKFDISILEHAYQTLNIPVPWSYRYEMCYRTLKNLYPTIKAIPPEKPHHALYDAKSQAAHATLLFTLYNLG